MGIMSIIAAMLVTLVLWFIVIRIVKGIVSIIFAIIKWVFLGIIAIITAPFRWIYRWLLTI